MLLHILDLDLGNLRIDVGDPSISNDDVKLVDAMGCELLHSVDRVSRDGGVDLDDEQRGAFSLGQVGECFGCWMIGVAVGSNDCVIGFGEVELEEALANTSVGTCDQNDPWSHDALKVMKKTRKTLGSRTRNLQSIGRE